MASRAPALVLAPRTATRRVRVARGGGIVDSPAAGALRATRRVPASVRTRSRTARCDLGQRRRGNSHAGETADDGRVHCDAPNSSHDDPPSFAGPRPARALRVILRSVFEISTPRAVF